MILCGGASKGAHFRALFAALFAPLPIYIPDHMGTRGSLYGLDPAIAQVQAKPFVGGEIREPERLEELNTLYNNLYERLYSQDPAGRPFRIDQRELKHETSTNRPPAAVC